MSSPNFLPSSADLARKNSSRVQQNAELKKKKEDLRAISVSSAETAATIAVDLRLIRLDETGGTVAEDTLKLVQGTLVAGKYRIERQIGAGGMGVVAVATHVGLNQKVAIKFLNEAALKSPEVVVRFEREARASSQLKSDHVARVLDVGTAEDGTPYMVMEYLEGRDLAGVIDSGIAIFPGVAVDYVMQAAEAIAEAHRAGIVHRDLKPANLFLTQRVDGSALVKVLDFGISKIQGNEAQDTKLTSTTAVIGSPSYMAPEQLRASRDVDHRGDIWSLGVILFELLTGSLPFEAANVMELCMRVASDSVPRVESRNPSLPRALCDVVARCLEKDPARRYQSVSELVDALAPFHTMELTTTAERIRRVSGSGQNTPVPNTARIPTSGSSARVVISGGTSVSWGKTEASMVPPPPPPSRSGAIVGVVLAAVFVFLAAGGGGTYYFVSHKRALASQAEMPMPTDRTNLPPMNSAGTGAGQLAQTAGSSTATTTLTQGLPMERSPLSPANPVNPSPDSSAQDPSGTPTTAASANLLAQANPKTGRGTGAKRVGTQAAVAAPNPPKAKQATSEESLPDSRK